MNATEFESHLALYARGQRSRAEQAKAEAAALRSDAEHAASQWSGTGAEVEAHRRAIKERAKVEAQKKDQVSQTHLERATVAEDGYLLHRNDVEVRDVHHCIENQHLIQAAYTIGGHPGLVKDSLD